MGHNDGIDVGQVTIDTMYWRGRGEATAAKGALEAVDEGGREKYRWRGNELTPLKAHITS